jgi:hypothetical protein
VEVLHAKKTSVITMCYKAHADVWRLTSQLLPEFVAADQYLVYVPLSEVPFFLSITNPAIQVLPQESLGGNFTHRLKAAVMSINNSERYGWYLQQFLKIEALATTEADLMVIWDADCVPLRTITLFDDFNAPIYMKAGEYHEPYFSMISRLLGLSRVQNQSFIVPGFPILKSWVEDFIQEVESRHSGSKWSDAVISCTDLSLRSGFSEFETLGTWIANSHPGEWKSSEVTWERRGQNRFGYAKGLSVEELLDIGTRENLALITFENWGLPGKIGQCSFLRAFSLLVHSKILRGRRRRAQ